MFLFSLVAGPDQPAVAAAAIALVGVLLVQGVIVWQSLRARSQWRFEQQRAKVIWAAEKAISADVKEGALGVAVLGALDGSAWLDGDDQVVIDAALAVAAGAGVDGMKDGLEISGLATSTGDDYAGEALPTRREEER